MLKHIKAIFPDENPLKPRIIELDAEIEIEKGKMIVKRWIFPTGSNPDDVCFFLDYVSDPGARLAILGVE